MKKILLRNLILTSIFAAIIAIAAPLSITISIIPYTLATFAIFLCGAILPPLCAMSATLVYIALGAIGLPVFSNYNGGFGVLFGLTGGFIWAYPLMALVIALSVKLFKKRSILSLTIGIIVAILICYSFGTLWFCIYSGKSIMFGLTKCVAPFILADIIKAIFAIVIALGLNRFSIINKKM